MQEDLANKILILSVMKLNANLPVKDITDLKTRIYEIRSMDVDVNDVFYLIDIELKYQERIQKRKTNIISNSNENLNELELLLPRIKENTQPELKELIKLFRIFINETNKASQVEDVIHLRNVLTLYEELQNKWNKELENKRILQKLLNLYFQMKSNSPKNSKLILKASKKLGELNWISQKLDDKQPAKEFLTNFTKVLESTFNNFKQELEIELSAYKILDKMRTENNSLSEEDSVNDQLVELLPTNFELLKQLKLHVWDNENVNPELLAPVTKIFLKLIQELSQSKEKIDLNNILLKTSIYPDTFTAESQEEHLVKNIVSKVNKAKQKCFACNMIAIMNKIKAKLFMDQEEKERREDSLNDIIGLIQKLQKNKNSAVKELSGELKTLAERLQDIFEMNHDPTSLSLLDKDLVEMFQKIEDMEEEKISVDIQVSCEDIIRKLLKLIQDQMTFEADDDEAHLDSSQELSRELNTLLSSDMNIFPEESKRKLEEILKALARIHNLLKLGIDLLSDEDLEEIENSDDKSNSEEKSQFCEAKNEEKLEKSQDLVDNVEALKIDDDSDIDVVIEEIQEVQEVPKEKTKKTRRSPRKKSKKAAEANIKNSDGGQIRSKPNVSRQKSNSHTTELSIEDLKRNYPDLWQQFVRKTGKVVSILEKKNSRCTVGYLKLFQDKNPNFALFSPIDNRFPRLKIAKNHCPPEFFTRPQDFEEYLFLAKLIQWDQISYGLGTLEQRLGSDKDIDARTKGILLENSIDFEDFPKNIEENLPDLPFKIPGNEIQKRRDFRQNCVFTIDPLTARDLDDALSIEQLKDNTYKVAVHIADVSYFVQDKTALDKEAENRATSVYLVQKVIPMLPRTLCEHLCSLNPGEDRLTFSVEWILSPQGEILDTW